MKALLFTIPGLLATIVILAVATVRAQAPVETKVQIRSIPRNASDVTMLRVFENLYLLGSESDADTTCSFFGPVPPGKGKPRFMVTYCRLGGTGTLVS